MTTKQEAHVGKKQQYTNEKIEKLRKEGNKMVTGIFRCFEPPGGNVSFSFKAYPNDPIKKYDFFDGQEYTIPLAVAKHLNNNCAYYQHKHILDHQGNPMVDERGKKRSRFAFQSTQYN